MIKLAAVAIFVFLSIPVFPQASNSTVRGGVVDSQSAVIAGAKVTLINTATNVARETVTNSAGLYVFPGATPGPYHVKVDFPGMRPFEGSLTLQVQQDATVDVVLQIATGVVTVDVQDVTSLVRVDSPSLGTSLERQRIESLPVNGRGYQNLLVTVPGIQWSSHGHGIGGRMQGNGLRTGTNVLLVDGAQQNEVWEGWDVARQPSLDALEELRIEVNNASAKFSRPTSVIMSTRAGTNALHGSTFYTNRNSAYGVARRRQDNFVKAPYVNRNEYGVSLGGPVIIPKLYNGRNRTFFFWNWEATKFITNSTLRMSVPSEQMRNGDFRQLVDSQGRMEVLYDPFTTNPTTFARQPLAYRGVQNTIDPARISPTAKYLFDHTRLPTNPEINPNLDANWIGQSRRPLDQDTRNIRIDHRFSDKNLIYARYSYNQHEEELGANHAVFLPIEGMRVLNGNSRWWPNHSLSTTWIHSFSPTLTNEVLISGLRDNHRRGAGNHVTPYASLMGLPNPFGAANTPVINDMELGPTATEYTIAGDGPFVLISNFLTLQNNATKIKGKHEFQFGLQYKWEETVRNIVSTAGAYSVNTGATSLYDTTSTPQNPIAAPFTGHGMANMFLGSFNYTAAFRRPWTFMRRQEYAPYFQDNWKVSQRLTLNLGMRWEYRTPLHDKADLMTSFDPQKKAYVIGTSLENFVRLQATLPAMLTAVNNYGAKIITYQEAGLPQNLVNNNWKQFGPRAGFAYRAFDGKLCFVLRGGYRHSYYTQPITNWFGSQNGQQITSASFQNSVTNTALSPDGLPQYGLRSVPQYIAGLNTPSSIINTNDTRLIARGFTAIQLDPNLADPYVQDWNLTLEKEIANNMVMRFAYTGNYSGNIQQNVQLNDATPDYIWFATTRTATPGGEFAGVARRPYDQQVYGTVTRYGNTGYSRWNGFQAEIERRFSNGVGFQAFWVVGNTMAQTGDIALPINGFLPGAVPQDFDARNRFLNYSRDTGTPKHQIRWNWIADLPFGRGKKFAGNAGGVVDKLIGGWQIAGTGNFITSYWNLGADATSGRYPTGTPIEIYGEKYPIQDCRSGFNNCISGFLYWNGYIPSNQINSVDSQGRPNGVMGVPANYKAAVQPLIPWGTTTLPANAPTNTNLTQFWDTNNVWLPINNAPPQRVIYNNQLHPLRNQRMVGPNQWFMDASLFKFAKLTEAVTLRFNIDFFNVLNNPNNPTNVNGNSGILETRNSGSNARFVQLTMRLQW